MAEQPDGKVGGFNLTLREVKETDAGDFMLWAADEEVKQFLLWETCKSMEEARTYISTFAIPHSWFRIICLDGMPIGTISLKQGRGFAKCRAELGFVLARSQWGKGIATEAVKIVLPVAFQHLQVERIEAVVAKENVASQRVLEKSGFVNEGLLCKYLSGKVRTIDCFMYRLLSSDNMPL
eukprot:Gb_01751 [translate_table: standard]